MVEVRSSNEKSPNAARPWLDLYDRRDFGELLLGSSDIISAFEDVVRTYPDRTAIIYFDRLISYAELAELSDAFANVLKDLGFMRGERLAVFLQNVPQFSIAALATWKLGGVLVPINPMNTKREMSVILHDCGPSVLVSQDTLYRDVIAGLAERPAHIFATSALEFQTRNDPRLFASMERIPCDVIDFTSAIASAKGRPINRYQNRSDDTALLVYTSGTSGVPKGAMSTHGGAMISAESFVKWMRIEDGDIILGLAPLFHITGIVAALLPSFVSRSPLILAYRYHPNVIADAIEENGAQVADGAITALMGLLNEETVLPRQLRTLTKIGTGGAPMPPTVLDQFVDKFGHYIYHGYGMTETNGPVVLVPTHLKAPIDAATGALSVGVAMPHATIWIADEDGKPVSSGQWGEIIIGGPWLAIGYWNRPAETAETMQPSGVRSGDIGFMDERGWLYLVDRKKDMINASGYKVWPKEIEDVIYTHPAVREAAVVGMPDAYRGETVRAVVSLKKGHSLLPAELREFCKERMATYKFPRIVDIVDDLPKTISGKILRRAVRDMESHDDEQSK